MKNLLKALANLFATPEPVKPQLSEPKLGSLYAVIYKGVTLATLSEPHIPDQFWVVFKLTPVTQNEDELKILYSESFWQGMEITIVDSDSGRTVLFLLSTDFEETEDELIPIDTLKNRPATVSLRGPYNVDAIKTYKD